MATEPSGVGAGMWAGSGAKTRSEQQMRLRAIGTWRNFGGGIREPSSASLSKLATLSACTSPERCAVTISSQTALRITVLLLGVSGHPLCSDARIPEKQS